MAPIGAQRGPGPSPGNTVLIGDPGGHAAPRATRAGAQPRQHPGGKPPVRYQLVPAQRGPGPSPATHKSAVSGCTHMSVAQRGPGPSPGNAQGRMEALQLADRRATRAGAGPRQHPDPPGLGTTAQWIAQQGPGPSPGNARICRPPRKIRTSAQRGPGPSPGNASRRASPTWSPPGSRNEGRGRTPATPGAAGRSRCPPGLPRNEGRGRTPATPSGSRRSSCPRRATRNEGRGRTPATPGSAGSGDDRAVDRTTRAGAEPRQRPSRRCRAAPTCRSRNEGRGPTPATPILPRAVDELGRARATRARAEPRNASVYFGGVDIWLCAQRGPGTNPGNGDVVTTADGTQNPAQRGPGRTPATPRCPPGSTSAGAARNEGRLGTSASNSPLKHGLC